LGAPAGADASNDNYCVVFERLEKAASSDTMWAECVKETSVFPDESGGEVADFREFLQKGPAVGSLARELL
jgi:hypothetical protein